MNSKTISIKELIESGNPPEILFWVGCAGSYDERYKKVTKSFVKILNELNINYGVLGKEEGCTGDPARRAGNEYLFQMQAINNINLLNTYNVKKIVTACPHCFNTIKNEYPALGGEYEVQHHSEFLEELINDGKIQIKKSKEKITYHDSCYLGRANNIYSAPRKVIESLKGDLIEMKRNKQNGLCCGAGGAQMFKEAEKGKKSINIERIEEAVDSGATTIASACPFCLTMMSDGIKEKNQEENIKTKDIVEILVENIKSKKQDESTNIFTRIANENFYGIGRALVRELAARFKCI